MHVAAAYGVTTPLARSLRGSDSESPLSLGASAAPAHASQAQWGDVMHRPPSSSSSSSSSSGAGTPAPISVVGTEVRSVEGCARWVVRGFSKLSDAPGFCVFSPEFQMAGCW